MSDVATCRCGVSFRYFSFERGDYCPDCEKQPPEIPGCTEGHPMSESDDIPENRP